MNHAVTLITLGALAAAGTFLAAGCDRGSDSPPATPAATFIPAPPGAATPAATVAAVVPTVSVADITTDWSKYGGKTLTVVADIEEVRGPRAFTLDEDSPLHGGIDNDLLVLTPLALAIRDLDDQWLRNKVRVTGVVHRFVAADVERLIGWDVDQRLEAEYEGKRPVLIASTVERVP